MVTRYKGVTLFEQYRSALTLQAELAADGSDVAIVSFADGFALMRNFGEYWNHETKKWE